MSVVLLTLPACPEINQEAVDQEKKLDDILEQAVKETIKECVSGVSLFAAQRVSQRELNPDMYLTLVDILNEIQRKPWAAQFNPLLPPGGGLVSKYSTIDQLICKHDPSGRNDDQLEKSRHPSDSKLDSKFAVNMSSLPNEFPSFNNAYFVYISTIPHPTNRITAGPE